MFMPDWIVVLLHGVILFGIITIYQMIWAKHSFSQNLFWITAMTSAAIIIQVLQGRYIEGRFDIVDILFYDLAYCLSVYQSLTKTLSKLFINL